MVLMMLGGLLKLVYRARDSVIEAILLVFGAWVLFLWCLGAIWLSWVAIFVCGFGSVAANCWK